MSEEKAVTKPFHYRCSSCGHGTTLQLPTEELTVYTWCTCCSKNQEDNRVFVRHKIMW
ncbi:MAG: hypothetical protein LBE70_04515 [Nitrososphaerota archaeon]|jgi:hypothetical protein|nr:hypothetical protein [Nitrososphaerota archaeon]